MATTADIRNGMCIEFNGNLFTIVYFQHVKPGKGPAFVRTKLKNINTGKVIENTFASGAKLSEIRIERRPYQFLYKDGEFYNFMHLQTFEQISIKEDIIEGVEFLKEGQEVEITFHAEQELALFAELPISIVLEITYTEPGMKGDTASSTALKAATLETGAIVQVPLFVNQGERIRIDTRTKSYLERAK